MATINGTSGDDTLTGTVDVDYINGLEGNDTISGGDGNDTLSGADGNDVINGDAGNDTIYAGKGDDTINGGIGNDWIVPSLGLDTVNAGGGDDTIEIQPGDTIVAGESVDGGAGYDTLLIEHSVISALPVDITGLDLTGVEAIKGDVRSSAFFVLADPGQLAGMTSLDGWFQFTTNDPVVLSGASLNGLFRLADGGATFDATGSTVPVEGLLAVGGGNGDDNITGSSGQDSLDGGSGNDVLNGGDGNDSFRDADGADEMHGGAGDDGFYYDTPEMLQAGEIIDGGADLDTLYLAPGQYDLASATVTGIEGIARFGSFAPQVSMTAAQFNAFGSLDAEIFLTTSDPISVTGKTFADGSAIYLSPVNNTLTLTGIVGSSPKIVGSTGKDTITGSNLADELIGADGNDLLRGGGGNDTLDGGSGSDKMYGGAGDDRLIVSDQNIAGDVVDGGDGFDTLVVDSLDISALGFTGIERIIGSQVSMTTAQANAVSTLDVGALTLTTGGSLALSGSVSAVFYYLADAGNALDLSAVTGTGFLSVTGNAGDDTVIGRDLADYSDNVYGNGGNDTLDGRAGDDVLNGGDGNDTMTGGLGNDMMYGGFGNDVFYVDSAADAVSEDAGMGNDRVFTTASYSLAPDAEIERLAVANAGSKTAIDLTGNAFANALLGNAGANTLDGNDGNDILTGYAGNDSLIGGLGDDALYGGNGADALDGGDGADVLNGGIGADSMTGGAGDDAYYVDNTGDTVSEASLSDGTDTVHSSVDFTLGNYVDDLTLTGTADLDGTGNSLANLIIGNSGANELRGSGGNDTLTGGLGDDLLIGGAGLDTASYAGLAGPVTVSLAVTGAQDTGAGGIDTLTSIENLLGTRSADTLTGNALGNTLDGGKGVDTLTGGAGNDSYWVDRTTDVIVEMAGQGTDTVHASASYTLSDNLEKLILEGTGNLRGTGNALDNTLTGNAGDNALDGGGGADRMIGGAGNDTYYVDNSADVVVEAAGGGTDTVMASATFVLGGEVENLTLTGAGAVNGTGNSAINTISGNSGSNTLNGAGGDDTLNGNAGNDSLNGGAGDDTIDGGAGADTMAGGAGDDIFVVDNAGDVVTESSGQGIDGVVTALASYTLAPNVEILVGASNVGQTLTGNSLSNAIFGSEGNDRISGGGGIDYLTGDLGADRFVFAQTGESPNGARDEIEDFTHSEHDLIDLSQIDAIAGGTNNAFTIVANFTHAAGQLTVHLVEAGHYLVQGDTTGDGIADIGIDVYSGVALSAGDFVL